MIYTKSHFSPYIKSMVNNYDAFVKSNLKRFESAK